MGDDFQLRAVTRGLLYAAAIYMIAWGGLVLLRPDVYCQLAGVDADYLAPNAQSWGLFGLLGGLFFLAFAFPASTRLVFFD